ncbi:MAG: hypothetical protein IVW56_01760 [Candidatus Binataceae bacterium]|nr:hypothetical protein [Candidatus Binataceae bacterium]
MATEIHHPAHFFQHSGSAQAGSGNPVSVNPASGNTNSGNTNSGGAAPVVSDGHTSRREGY